MQGGIGRAWGEGGFLLVGLFWVFFGFVALIITTREKLEGV